MEPGSEPGLGDLANEVVLEGVLVEAPMMRATPNGRSVLSLELEHETLDVPSGQRTACHMMVVALDRLAEEGRSL
jgi:primosomal replication protein N